MNKTIEDMSPQEMTNVQLVKEWLRFDALRNCLLDPSEETRRIEVNAEFDKRNNGAKRITIE